MRTRYDAETLSTSMWEAMNTTYRAIPSGHFRSMRPPVAFRWVRDRAAQINGIAEATMTRDEGYQFLVLGRSIERADMTSRLVASASLTTGSTQWPAVLRGCGGHDAFLRTYPGLHTDREAAQFLIVDNRFPRSIMHGLAAASDSLRKIALGSARPEAAGSVQRSLGQLRAHLEYAEIGDLVANLDQVSNDPGSETRRRAGKLLADLQYARVDEILATGLHAYLTQFLDRVNEVGARISQDFLMPAS